MKKIVFLLIVLFYLLPVRAQDIDIFEGIDKSKLVYTLRCLEIRGQTRSVFSYGCRTDLEIRHYVSWRRGFSAVGAKDRILAHG